MNMPCLSPSPRTGQRARQAGFTLVELMISVTLGLLIMIALIAVYLNVTRTNTEMAKTNSLIENGRFSIDILEEDISHAGFWGGYVPVFDDTSNAAVPGDAPSLAMAPATDVDPCLAYANWAATTGYKAALLGIPVQTFDVAPTNCTGSGLPVNDKKASTDVLVVRHVDNCLPGVGTCDADTIADAVPRVYFQSSLCSAETQATPTAYRYVLSNTPADFTLKIRGCTGTPPATVGTAADRRKYVSNLYYIRTYAVTAGDGIPTLMRSSFGLNSGGTAPAYSTPVALIEGIEGFAVELGVDAQSRCGTAPNYAAAPTKVDPTTVPTCSVNATTAASNTLPTNRGDGIPETWVRCSGATGCTNAQLQDVVATKLFVLARSRDTTPGLTDDKVYCLGTSCAAPTGTGCPMVGTANAFPLVGPFCDGYRRHVFQTTIRLANVAGRRETP